MQAKLRHVCSHQRDLPGLGHVVVARGGAIGGVGHQRVVFALHVGRQEIDGPGAVQSTQVERQVPFDRAQPLVQRISCRGCGACEAQAVVVHQPQRLDQIRNNAACQQLPFEDQILLAEVVQAVDHEGIDGVVEIVPVVGAPANDVRVVVHMGHLSARQDGILRVAVAFPSRFVVGVVNFQRACDFFNGACHPTQQRLAVRIVFAVHFRLDAQRLGPTNVQLEGVVVKGEAGPRKLKLARLNHAVEFETSVFSERQFSAIGNDFDILSFTDPKPANPLQ